MKDNLSLKQGRLVEQMPVSRTVLVTEAVQKSYFIYSYKAVIAKRF